MAGTDDASELIVERQAHVTRLSLNRGERGNALSPALVQAISAALEVAHEDGTRLLVIGSARGHFCTGLDLSDLDAQTDDTLLARAVRIELMLQQLHTAPFATLALASGRVMGAGADLFAACESRWIVGRATFAFPGAGFGLVLGTARLAALVGPERACQWVGTGSAIDADAALHANFASARYTVEETPSAVQGLADSMLRLDLVTHAAIRRASLERGEAGLAADLAALVMSAARPGLKTRIAAYRRASQQSANTGATNPL